MRVQIFSDVHMDFRETYVPVLAAGVGVVVVAGDVCSGVERGARWLRGHLGDGVAIVMVAGNHEYFERVIGEERDQAVAAAAQSSVTFLDDRVFELGGVRFIGTTLWADYELYGADRRDEMMAVAQKRMMDHRLIQQVPGRLMTPGDSLQLHRQSLAFLERTLETHFAGPTVVVTHHGPHPLSLATKYRDDHLSAAFISDLSGLIARTQPVLWVHGHTHVSRDYHVGTTRVICNPHGYGSENPAFDPHLTVDLAV